MRRPFPRSVVIGAGLAGIAAAAALRSVSDEVVVLERDVLGHSPSPRRGIPQSEQLHNLLTRAQQDLEWLLPGFAEALWAAGCGEARVADQTHVFELGARMPERDLGLRLVCARRPVIEHVARTIMRRDSHVSIYDGTSVAGLVLGRDGAVAGVETDGPDGRRVVEASLVVDAAGVGSQASRWVEALEHGRPHVDEVRHDQWYATQVVERPPSRVGEQDFWLTFASPPRSRAGLLCPVDRQRWHVSLSGCSCDPRPRTYSEMVGYAGTLEDPAIADLLAGARPSQPVHVFRKTTAVWRRWDLLDDPISGFLPIGDSIAALNPLFGQGTSVAAWQARELAVLVEELGGDRYDLFELTRTYLRRAAAACAAAWRLGSVVAEDHGLARLVHDDAVVHRRYVELWHLVTSADEFDATVAASRGAVSEVAGG